MARGKQHGGLQVKEIIYPGGAEIDIRAIRVGDPSMSVMEIWGAEYQENDCVLIKPDARQLLQGVCDRERCIMQVSCNGWHTHQYSILMKQCSDGEHICLDDGDFS